MNLTPHFTYKECIRSGYAERNKIDNQPSDEELLNISIAALGMEEVRKLLKDLPITVTSWFRNPIVNAGIGGSKTSSHMKGFAVDFVCPKFGTPLEICIKLRDSGLKFDQLIEEGTWVHISFDPKMRQQLLTKTNTGYALGIGL